MVVYDYYRIFYYVAQYKSFTRAAEVLGNNQPNITRCMNNLENELNCQLFVRSNRGVRLTPEGQKLYEHVAIAFEQLQMGEDELRNDRSLESGMVTIGASETTLQLRLLDTLEAFHNQYPHVRLKISNHSTPQAVSALENGLVDFAIVTTPLTSKKDLQIMPLSSFREILIGGHKYRELAKETQTLESIRDIPLISLVANTGSRELYEKYPSLGSISAPRKGNSTSDNDRFLRFWYEVGFNRINTDCTAIDRAETMEKRWFPYNKGGGFRKWYGFNEYIIDWYDDGAEIRAIPTAVIANYQYFMHDGLTWSTLTSGKFSIRQFGRGYIFDNGGCCIFELGDRKNFICGLLNSKVFAYIFGQLNPTLNFQSGEVAKFPVICETSAETDRLVEECVEISKAEYDSFETSRDFRRHPLISQRI